MERKLRSKQNNVNQSPSTKINNAFTIPILNIFAPVNIIINKCDISLSDSNNSEKSEKSDDKSLSESLSKSSSEQHKEIKINLNNLQKKILPARKNRGLRMKSLEGQELEEEDEFYKKVFGEGTSDDEFDPFKAKLSDKDSFDTDFGKEESVKNGNLFDNSSDDENVTIIRKKKTKKKRSAIKIVKKSKGDNLDNEDHIKININDSNEIGDNDGNEHEDHDNDMSEKSESSEEEVIIRKKKKHAPKRINKKFIDANDEDEEGFLNKKRYKPSAHLLKIKQQKEKSREKAKLLKEKRFDKDIEKESKVSNQKSSNSEINNNKPTQKDLLFEAIFTEIYNIRELENIERLEELNKQDNSNSNKKQFVDYIKTLRTVKNLNDENEVIVNEKVEEKNNKCMEKDNDRNMNIDQPNNNESINDDNNKDNNEDNNEENNEFNNIIENELKSIQQKQDRSSNKENTEQQELFNKQSSLPTNPKSFVTFTNTELYQKIFKSFNVVQQLPKKNHLCAISNEPAKYFDPLTKQYYSNMENFKILRERYFQKEEDNLLFRIQTLSDFASQKKEKLKKYLLSSSVNINESTNTKTPTNNTNNINTINTNMLDIVNKYGLLKTDVSENEKKSSAHRIYSRNRENCIESGMLLKCSKNKIIISKKIFRDKHSNKTYMLNDNDDVVSICE